MGKMDVEKLIKTYQIKQYGHPVQNVGWVYEQKIMIGDKDRAMQDDAIEEIKSKKTEIIRFLAEQRVTECKARIEEIEGLQEIKAALADLHRWHAELEQSFDTDGGLTVREFPKYDISGMFKKYPVAKAYLDAEEYAKKNNLELSEIGSRALDRLIYEPERYVEILADMQAELKKFDDAHIWD